MPIDDVIPRDAVIRQAAFDHVRALQTHDPILSHEAIKQGFVFEGQRWPLINPQRGIFKPRGMSFLLSIRTVVPRKGTRVWYDDQRRVHRQIFAGDDELNYAFIVTDPATPDKSGCAKPPSGGVASTALVVQLPRSEKGVCPQAGEQRPKR